MCGLFATYLKNIDTQVTDRLNLRGLRSLKHRGPDRQGYFSTQDGNVFLGHSLLSVSTQHADEGKQPIRTNKWAMVYNGEIYNHRHLREKLTALGIFFEGDSDTETLLRGIDHLGNDRGRLRQRYAAVNHPMAAEVVRWLDGIDTVDSWVEDA